MLNTYSKSVAISFEELISTMTDWNWEKKHKLHELASLEMKRRKIVEGQEFMSMNHEKK